jgi:glycosyltransferase involved in cell wall biosynthesis
MLLAQLCLIPAGAGLGIVDTFALGTPLVTTDRFSHGVEIDYLEHGANGWICRDSPDAREFADCVVSLLENTDRLDSLRSGALLAGDQFSTETMVENLADGILKAIETPLRR